MEALDFIIIFSAKYLGYVLLAVFLILFLKNRSAGWRTLFIPLISAVVSRFVFTEIIRFFYFRPRPFVTEMFNPLIEHAADSSFPSGHAAFYFALSAGVYYYNKKAGIWFFIVSLVIGFSRVFAGVHYFSDILGGLALGIFSFWVTRFLYQKIIL